jgi:hypothetical protein
MEKKKRREKLRKPAQPTKKQRSTDGGLELANEQKSKSTSRKIENTTSSSIEHEHNDDSDFDSDVDSSDGDIAMVGDGGGGDKEEFTFEFNDMKEDYAEGICTLLKSLFANPTSAWAAASTITAQGTYGRSLTTNSYLRPATDGGYSSMIIFSLSSECWYSDCM